MQGDSDPPVSAMDSYASPCHSFGMLEGPHSGWTHAEASSVRAGLALLAASAAPGIDHVCSQGRACLTGACRSPTPLPRNCLLVLHTSQNKVEALVDTDGIAVGLYYHLHKKTHKVGRPAPMDCNHCRGFNTSTHGLQDPGHQRSKLPATQHATSQPVDD